MKKSELYHLAQIAVVHSNCITPERKLDILRVLFADEEFAQYGEERDTEKAADAE